MQSNPVHFVDPSHLETFASQVLQKLGLDPADAQSAAQILVDADLHGIDTHGVINLKTNYADGLARGVINPRPTYTVTSGSPTTKVLDADNGLGLLAAKAAMDQAIEMAAMQGCGFTTVNHSNHCGAGAYYVRMAARRGMVGIHFSSGGSTVAAPGGKGKLIGNNVCAVAAPAGRLPAFVFDMAPTMTVANRARMLGWDGRSMPPGWVIDDEGRPVTDPERYFDAGSAVLPLGGTVDGGAHKGFGLLMVSDILTGMLSGDGGSMLREKGAESHICGAMRVDAFVPMAIFESLMERMADTLHRAPSLEGDEALRYPGEGSDRLYRERKSGGIPLHPRLVDELRSLGTMHGVAWDVA